MSLFHAEERGGPSRRPLLWFLLLTLAVGASASLFTEPSIPTWYAGLNRPAIAPPNWLFAPVWTALYIAMAYAAFRVWRVMHENIPAREAPSGAAPVAGPGARGRRRGPTKEMAAYAIQLALNFFWSAVFFALHRIGAALVEISLLWLAIAVTAILFWRRDRIAGLLFLPYLAWVGFAWLLNHAFWQLNP